MNSNSKLYLQRPVEWAIVGGLSDYDAAVTAMERRVDAIHQGEAGECVVLLEHPPLYTAGVSAQQSDLTDPNRFPVYKSSRGGQFTYHGPGQRVAYLMLDLTKRGRDVRAFVNALEEWVINTLADYAIIAERRTGRVGVWVDRTQEGGPVQEDKIAAIGVRVRKWVTYHGIAINLEPDLSHFSGIVPCGISQSGLGVTSIAALTGESDPNRLDEGLRHQFEQTFGPTDDPVHLANVNDI